MFCAACGAEIDDRAVICPKCGVPVAGTNVAATGPVTVPNYMVWAILSAIFCCQIGGIIAIVYAAKVNTKVAQGDIAGAQAASKSAKNWIIASVIVGFIFAALYFVLGVAGAMGE